MSSVLQDLRFAVRRLLGSPTFTLGAVISLALGIGATTAIFSVVDGVLLRPAPFPHMDRLAMVWETDRQSGTTHEPGSVPDYIDYRARSRQFAQLTAFQGGEVNFAPADGQPARLASLDVDNAFLSLTGVEPILGRGFAAGELAAGGPDVVMIGEALWRGRFAGDPGMIGRTIRLDGVPRTVVGVVPDNADFGVYQILQSAAYERAFADRGERTDVEIWLPLRPDAGESSRDTHPIFMLGRLAPGATVATAQQEMARIAGELESSYAVNAGRGAFVEPLSEVVFGPVRPALYLLLGAVGLVLLVACVNVANLLLARGTVRAREVAVRAALGAGRARLARQFLLEGVVLALTGGAVGALLAVFGTRALLAAAPADIPRIGSAGVNGAVLLVTLAITALVGLGFGLVPLVQSWRIDLHSTLKSEGAVRVAGGGAGARVRAGLVVGQLALAVTLLAGAGLLIRSFLRLQDVDTGFRTAGVLKAEFQLPPSRYPVNFSAWPDFKEMHLFNARLLERAASLPGVQSVGIAGNGPLDAGFTNSFAVVGRESEAEHWPEISVRRVTPGYFPSVGLGLIRGRLFETSDGTTAPPVALINETAVRRFFPDGKPLGAQIRMWGAARTIVGVVANERFHGVAEAAPIALYLPLAQAPSFDGAETLLLRTSRDPAELADAVRAAIRSVDPALATFGVEPLSRTLARSVAKRHFTMLLLGMFAAVAILLAALGIHGVLSFTVARRTREMGIRLALGAGAGAVVGMVLRQSLVLAAAGLLLGGLGALGLSRLLQHQLYATASTDPLTWVAVAVVLGLAAMVASALPARRATRIDPAQALRDE